MPSYNGIHLMNPPVHITATIELDSRLTGCGAIFASQYYHTPYPDFLLDQCKPICHLEMLNIVVAAKTWDTQWAHHTIRVLCDNMSTVQVLLNGHGRDSYLLQCASELWLLSATHIFSFVPAHKPGAQMTAADALSRAHLRTDFCTMLHDIGLEDAHRVNIPPERFILDATFKLTFITLGTPTTITLVTVVVQDGGGRRPQGFVPRSQAPALHGLPPRHARQS